MFNVISDPWIPVRRRSGINERIAPWEIGQSEDPVVAIAAPRPDFDGALTQFLLALLQTAAAPGTPQGPVDWADWMESPPSGEVLRAAFEPLAPWFRLTGDAPRFLQDPTLLEESAIPVGIDGLVIEANETHFFKPGRIHGACAACTATLVFALQTNSPEGGRGHYTSVRGGGPLTTLLAFDPVGNDTPGSLWHDLWLNVLDDDYRYNGDPARTFPWLDPARFVKARLKRDVLPEDVHPLQVLWNMPRRLWLDSEHMADGRCDLCGEPGPLFQRLDTRPNGVSYSNEPVWRHPWTPHYASDAQATQFSPAHPQPGGFTYRSWPGLALGDPRNTPARVVAEFLDDRRLHDTEQLRIHAFGFDMKSNKARCWYDSTVPLYRVPKEIGGEFSDRVTHSVSAATHAAELLRSAIKNAWFKRPGDARGDTAFLEQTFYEVTEPGFYRHLAWLRRNLMGGEDTLSLRQDWHRTLRRAALDLFDRQVARAGLEFADPRRIARAYDQLRKQLNGKTMKEILALDSFKEEAA